jgi:hypothetical protein
VDREGGRPRRSSSQAIGLLPGVWATAGERYFGRVRRTSTDLSRLRRDDGACGTERAGTRDRDWICLECQETDEFDLESWASRPTTPGPQDDPWQ